MLKYANIYLPKGWYGVGISTRKVKTRSASSGFFIMLTVS